MIILPNTKFCLSFAYIQIFTLFEFWEIQNFPEITI